MTTTNNTMIGKPYWSIIPPHPPCYPYTYPINPKYLDYDYERWHTSTTTNTFDLGGGEQEITYGDNIIIDLTRIHSDGLSNS